MGVVFAKMNKIVREYKKSELNIIKKNKLKQKWCIIETNKK